MVNKRKENKATIACVIILVVSTLLFTTVALSSGKRNKAESITETTYDTATEVPEESKSPATEKPTEAETEKKPETTKKDVVAESEPEEMIPTAVTVDDIDFGLPAEGAVLVSCSLDAPVYSLTMNDYRTHNGVDISAPVGSGVFSCATGTVASVFEDPMMGMTVVVRHAEGIESVYRNLSLELPAGVEVGAPVATGQVIGTVGETALIECEEESHLHFELVVNGENVDPLEYIEIASISDVYEG